MSDSLDNLKLESERLNERSGTMGERMFFHMK